MLETRTRPVRDLRLRRAWSSAHAFCQACGWSDNLVTHHIVKPGRSDESCNLFRVCLWCHAAAEGESVVRAGVVLPVLKLGMVLHLKRLHDPGEYRPQRLAELFGRALPEEAEVPEYYRTRLLSSLRAILWGKRMSGLKASPLTERQQREAERNLPLAVSYSRWLYARKSAYSLTQDDFVSAAHVGLLRACRRFDGGMGIPFNEYLKQCIRSALKDAYREHDRYSRLGRQLVAAGLERERKTIQFGVSADFRADAEDAGEAAERSDEFRQAIRTLAIRDRVILRLLVHYGWRQEEIAAAFGLTGPRVSQIVKAALTELGIDDSRYFFERSFG